MLTGTGIPEDCVDKPWYANCQLIVEGDLCRHPYFGIFCCRSCHLAGRLPWSADYCYLDWQSLITAGEWPSTSYQQRLSHVFTFTSAVCWFDASHVIIRCLNVLRARDAICTTRKWEMAGHENANWKMLILTWLSSGLNTGHRPWTPPSYLDVQRALVYFSAASEL